MNRFLFGMIAIAAAVIMTVVLLGAAFLIIDKILVALI